MSTVTSPIDAEPVGPQGARVDITQRPALAVTGLFRHLASGPRTGQFSLSVDSSSALLGTQLVDQQLSLAHVDGHLWTQAVLFLR